MKKQQKITIKGYGKDQKNRHVALPQKSCFLLHLNKIFMDDKKKLVL